MSDFEVKHKHLNPNKLKPLTRLMLGLAAVALAATACQKSSPPIIATVPDSGIVLTFIPSDKGNVKAVELAANQPDKRLKKFNAGDAYNTYELVNNKNLTPQNAALCADDIVRANLPNLQPEPADSKGRPASAREVIAPEGGLYIPTEICGELKDGSAPATSTSPPKQTQTATSPKPETKALINNENIVAVLGTFCFSIIGLGAGLRGLLALRGRKEKKSKSDTQLIPTHTIAKTKPQIPAILDVVSLDGVLYQVHGGGGYVRDLDSQKISPIDWKDYILVNKFGLPVNVINDEKIRNRLKLNTSTPRISDKQIKSIHWGEGSPSELKGFVTAYGFFKHK